MANAAGAGSGHTADGNVLNAKVSELVYAGSTVRLHAGLPSGQRLVAYAQVGSSLEPGVEVQLTWPIERGRCVAE